MWERAVFLSVVLLFTVSASAAEHYHVRMLGKISYAQLSDELFPPQSSAPVRVQVDMIFEQGNVAYTTTPESFNFVDTVVGIEVTFFDALNQPIMAQSMPSLIDAPSSSKLELERDGTWSELGVKYGNTTQLIWGLPFYHRLLSQTEWRFYEYSGEPRVEFFWISQNNGNSFSDFAVAWHTLEEILPDADGDGVADADDQCAATLASDTVWFDGVNSGVANHIDANGCAITDHYASCEAEQPSSNLFSYSGPTQCEMLMGYQLYREGLIDYTELRMLRNAL